MNNITQKTAKLRRALTLIEYGVHDLYDLAKEVEDSCIADTIIQWTDKITVSTTIIDVDVRKEFSRLKREMKDHGKNNES